MKDYQVDPKHYHAVSLSLGDIPLVGAPGCKQVTMEANWGMPKSTTISFVVTAQESADVYNKASQMAKEAASKAGADPAMAVYKIISIEGAQ